MDLNFIGSKVRVIASNPFSIKFERNYHKYQLIIQLAIFIALSAFTVSLIPPYNYRRAFVLVFIPLSVIWIQIDVADKIPVVEYGTQIEKILLLTFVTCIILAGESVILYCYLQTKKTGNYKKKQSRKYRKRTRPSFRCKKFIQILRVG